MVRPVINEGRAQRFRAYDPAYYDNKTDYAESWRAGCIHCTAPSKTAKWTDQLDHVIDAVIAAMPQFCRY